MRPWRLPVAGDHVSAYAINNAGVVAASYASGSFQRFAALGAPTARARSSRRPGYGTYDAEAINEAGAVVGNRDMVAMRWDGDEMTVLSENGRLAHGEQSLNDRGDAVGWVLEGGMSHAVLWPAGGKQVDLACQAPPSRPRSTTAAKSPATPRRRTTRPPACSFDATAD